MSGGVRGRPAAAPPESWQPFVEAYVRSLLEDRGMSRASAGNARTHAVAFARFVDGAPRGGLFPAEVDRWLESTSWSESTRQVARGRVRDLLRWAAVAGYTEDQVIHVTRPLISIDDPVWESLVGDYLESLLARGLKPGGVSTTRTRLVSLGRHLAGTAPAAVTAEDLDAWVAATGWSPGVRAHGLRAARALLRWAEQTGRITVDLSVARLQRTPRRAGAWGEAIDEFEDHLRATARSLATVDGYCRHLEWLAQSVEPGPWELSSSELATWLDSRNWSAETRRKVLVSLNKFYAWATAAGRLDWAPTAGLPRRAHRLPGPAAEEFPERWREPVAGWVDHLRAGARSDDTIEGYLARLRPLTRAAADPWKVTTEQLEEWLSNPDWAPATKRGARVALRSFYRWAVRARHVQESPARDLGPVSIPRALPRPAPRDALRAALAAADDQTRLMVMLAAYAGLRRGEIARLHTSQVTDTHLMVVGKGGHHRVVPLHTTGDLKAELAVELERRRRGTHGTGWNGPFVTAHGYLFPSLLHPGPVTPQHVGRRVSAVLPEGWTAHTLRHRFATDAYAAERDLLAVQQLLGHARPETTAGYAQAPDGAKLAAVIAAGPDRLRQVCPEWG